MKGERTNLVRRRSLHAQTESEALSAIVLKNRRHPLSCPSATCLSPSMPGTLPEPFATWFAAQGWSRRPHQLAMLDAAKAGDSVLLIAPTGGGKTLAGFLPSLIDLTANPRPGLHTLYVSPLK